MRSQFGTVDGNHVALQIVFNDLAEFTKLLDHLLNGGGIETVRELAFTLLTQAKASGDLSPTMRELEKELIK